MQRITLKTAIDYLTRVTDADVAIVTRSRGFGIEVGAAGILRSQREDELAFLTYDGAVNYVQRHLCPQLARSLRIVIDCPPCER